MAFSIGRCTLNEDPRSVSMSGDRVGFELDIVPTSANDLNQMRAQRQQLLGLADNVDEEVVPVVWSEDPTFDGFYRVIGVSVPSNDVMLSTGYLPGCSVTLERLRGYATPLFETYISGVVRTNAHGITTPAGTRILNYPSATYEYDATNAPAKDGADPDREVTLVDGVQLQNFRGRYPITGSFTHALPPGNRYSGGCLLEVKYGSTWYPVIGRDIGAVSSGSWRISNGIIRLTSGTSTTSTLEVWNGSAWESSNITHYATSAFHGIGESLDGVATPRRITVLRNGPECVVVRHGSAVSSTSTYVLWKGHLHVEWTWKGITNRSGMGFPTTTACTAVTGGFRQTSNDANGNRVQFVCDSAITTDLVNGYAQNSGSPTSVTWGIGVEFGGSSATASFAAGTVSDDFFAAVSMRDRIIVR